MGRGFAKTEESLSSDDPIFVDRFSERFLYLFALLPHYLRSTPHLPNPPEMTISVSWQEVLVLLRPVLYEEKMKARHLHLPLDPITVYFENWKSSEVLLHHSRSLEPGIREHNDFIEP